jgi:hypothetical protein
MAGGRQRFCELFGRPPSGAMLLQIELGSNASDPVLKKQFFCTPYSGRSGENRERAPPSGLEIGHAAQEALGRRVPT